MFRKMKALWWLLCAGALLAACGGAGTDTAADNQVAQIQLSQSSALFTSPGQEVQLSVRTVNAAGETVNAAVVWTSSLPDQVSVDATGKVKSITPIGSATIVAESGGLRSAPVLISTVQLRPGTLLLRDADVVEVVPPPASAGFPGAGIRYDIWLAGQQAPALGTIVLAIETANVSGRVVETAVEANRVRVRLERLAMPDLLARYDVNWVIDLAAYELVIDGEQTSQGRETPEQRRERALAEPGSVSLWKIPKEGVKSPCSASVEAKLKAKPVQVKISGSPKLEAFSSRFDETLPPGRFRVALVGDFYIETSVGLTAEAGLEGEVKCQLRAHIPLKFLPPPFNFFLQVPVGIGVAASGRVDVASIDIGYSGKNGATFEMGVDCAPLRGCVGLDRAERINEFTPNLEVSSAQEQGLRIELEVGAYFLTGLDAKFEIGLAEYEYRLIDVKAGPKQKADFGTIKRQIDVVPYASKYDLAFVLEVGPGSAVKDAIAFFMGGEPGELSFGLKGSFPISESPRGTWAPDKTTAIPNRDIVKLKAELTPFSTKYWLLGYNVDRVEIYRRHESEREFSLMRTLTAIEPQASFETTWDPGPADAGLNEFAVFAVSKLPVVRLEIGSVKTVQVGCIAASGSGRERPLAVGVCKEEWTGSASAIAFDLQRITLPAPFVWEPHPSLVLGPNISVLRPKQGQSRMVVNYLVYDNLGCTVTPAEFDTFTDTTIMAIDRNFSPAKYSFFVGVETELTISCPDAEPLKVFTRVNAVSGAGELTEQGTRMAGSISNQYAQSQYQFDLKVDQPPPPVP